MRYVPDEEVQALFDDLETAGAAHARAKAAAEGLKEDRKITKSQLMNIAEAEGVRSISQREVFAYSHPTYKAVVAKLVKAIEEEALADYKYRLADVAIQAWRTWSADTRAARGP